MANGVLGDLSLKRKLFHTKPEEGAIFVEFMDLWRGFHVVLYTKNQWLQDTTGMPCGSMIFDAS